MKACFIGHRHIHKREELASALRKNIIELICKGTTTFFFGSKSEFNDLCLEIVSELKTRYPFIKRIYVRSAYPYINKDYEKYLLETYEETYFPTQLEQAGKYSYVERNREMIDNSTYCIFYYDENYIPSHQQSTNRNSGTKIAYQYAIQRKKVIVNLYTLL